MAFSVPPIQEINRRPMMANKCGDCQLFQGSSAKCGGGQSGRSSGFTACSSSYSPIPG